MKVMALSKRDVHGFSKVNCDRLNFLQGLGIEGDAHCGETVKHRSRVAQDPNQPNLRQVHLLPAELLAELVSKGFNVQAGSIGENVLTQGIDLIHLPQKTRLRLGQHVVLTVTGLRNPCAQLDNYQKGLTKAVLDRDSAGNLVRKSGVMATVEHGGEVKLGDLIEVMLPAEPHLPLERV